MSATWISLTTALLLGGILACTDHAEDVSSYRATCLTHADVLQHAERSRNGLSATCDEAVRARNAAR